MKLAEALTERADIQNRLQQLQKRCAAVVRIQEGDVPDEDPAALLQEFAGLSGRLARLVVMINRVNSTTAFDENLSIADAIALRDQAAREQKFFNHLADEAAARTDRYSRSEIKFVAAYPVADLRSRADQAAKRFRELDTALQQKNWTTNCPAFD